MESFNADSESVAYSAEFDEPHHLSLALSKADLRTTGMSLQNSDYGQGCNTRAILAGLSHQWILFLGTYQLHKMLEREHIYASPLYLISIPDFIVHQVRASSKDFLRRRNISSSNRSMTSIELQLSVQHEGLTVETLLLYGYLLHPKFEVTNTIVVLNQGAEAMKAMVVTYQQQHPEDIRLHGSLVHDVPVSLDCVHLENSDWTINTFSELQSSPISFSSPSLSRIFEIQLRQDRLARIRSRRDINDGVAISWRAVMANPSNSLKGLRIQTILSTFRGRHEACRSPQDLSNCIDLATTYVHTTEDEDVVRSACLGQLAEFLSWCAERTGSLKDLNRAIDTIFEAVAISQDKVSNARQLFKVANLVKQRHRITRSVQDLNQAIGLFTNAKACFQPADGSYYTILSSMARMLFDRFLILKSNDDFHRIISLSAEALQILPRDHPRHADAAHLLSSVTLSRHFMRCIYSVDDVTTALNFARRAVNADKHCKHPWYSHQLGLALIEHAIITDNPAELNEGLQTVVKSVAELPPDRYYRSICMLITGRLRSRGVIKYGDRCLSSFGEILQSKSASPSFRIRAAMDIADIMISRGDWKKSAQLLEDAIEVLPTISQRSLDHSGAQFDVSGFYGLASTAAAAALNAGKDIEDALRLLELGRGIIAGLVLDMREDITDLQRDHPDLAERFIVIRNELGQPSSAFQANTGFSTQAAKIQEAQLNRRREAEVEFQRLTKEIRTRPNFSNFLQSPPIHDMRIAAKGGPIIVINIAYFRCDAFLIEHDSIQAIPLPNVTMSDIDERAKQLQEPQFDLNPLLAWLWNTICGPCLEALNLTSPVDDDGNWPHVWWIPTGALSQFPLHAAGIHTGFSRETVLDRVESSYASSLRALLHSREYRAREHSSAANSSALIVSMRDTPGLDEKPLPYAAEEADWVKRTCAALGLTPIIPRPEKGKILSHLQNSRIFHFAGHGESDPKDPSQSKLLLNDWQSDPLSLQNLRDSRLQDNHPFLAYLSACSTGSNKAEGLEDEGIHLMSAFQLAGFQHVIGTLWEVSDRACVDVAKIVYRTLQEKGMNDEAVSRGLHLAVRALRDEAGGRGSRERNAKLLNVRPRREGLANFNWVPYVHFGV